VQSNRAVGFGGGLNNNSSGGALTVRDSTVASNTAAGFGGGGINNNSNGNTLVLRSSITGNSAQNGGGINNNSTGPLTVGETLIAGNTALGTIGGGGILNNSTGTFTLFQSTVSGNSSAGFGGGGIDSNSSGTVNITNSTISGNSTTGSNGGGGVYKNSSAAISMTSVTITGNSSTNGGSNIHDNSAGGSLSLLNSIVANPVGGSNCGGDPITSNGFNLASDASCNLVAAGDLQNTNPLLGALANNGGLTPTHALLIGSPAIDAGTAAGGSVDQRGVARPVGAGFDIGAFEGTGAAPPPPATAQAIPTLSDWALILLSLLIGGTALTRFGRRRG
jgi:hypothetical protein